MTCDEVTHDLLLSHLDHDLDRESAYAVRSHLQGCAVCARRLEEVRGIALGIVAAVAAERPPVPQAAEDALLVEFEKIAAAARAESGGESEPVPRAAPASRFTRRQILGSAAAAALFLTALVGGFRDRWFQERTPESDRVATAAGEPAAARPGETPGAPVPDLDPSGFADMVVVRESAHGTEAGPKPVAVAPEGKDDRGAGPASSGTPAAVPDTRASGSGGTGPVAGSGPGASPSGSGREAPPTPDAVAAAAGAASASAGEGTRGKATLLDPPGTEALASAGRPAGSGWVPPVPGDAVTEDGQAWATDAAGGGAASRIADGPKLRGRGEAEDRLNLGAARRVAEGGARPRGDVNGDGRVDIADSMLITRAVVHGDARVDVSNGDANGDGRVDIADSMAISNRVVAAVRR